MHLFLFSQVLVVTHFLTGTVTDLPVPLVNKSIIGDYCLIHAKPLISVSLKLKLGKWIVLLLTLTCCATTISHKQPAKGFCCPRCTPLQTIYLGLCREEKLRVALMPVSMATPVNWTPPSVMAASQPMVLGVCVLWYVSFSNHLSSFPLLCHLAEMPEGMLSSWRANRVRLASRNTLYSLHMCTHINAHTFGCTKQVFDTFLIHQHQACIWMNNLAFQ